MKEDSREKRIGIVAGCSTHEEAMKFARENWPNHIVTKVRKIGGGVHREVYGRPRKRGRGR